MKRNLLGLFAVVLAVAVSSFTVKKTTAVYFQYSGSGAHDDRSSYSEGTAVLAPVTGTSVLAWIKVDDNNGIVTDPEFDALYSALDRSNPENGSLNDAVDTEGTVGTIYQLEKKNP